ncbi:putative sensor domain DACNV-containing protein [Pontibacter sp. HSC-36F09]|uniref:putative sensor domain DACNV-containing protein n=1 Tax=Pontibacter sp. HSC-36F09 TaxID=2910966 RepID=UPI00209D577C|nr:hypothetical protein [Pontibacter sp. HSC-36F09]MCP2044902.1 hypothetical protein [Pontibacter sp. HSC-36F09]
MIGKSTYKAAREVAQIAEDHFASQINAAKEINDTNLATIPPARIIETMIDAAFWASLRREEGHSPRLSLAFLRPEQSEQPLLFEHHLSLTSAVLTKIGPGVERPGIHLGVWYEGDFLHIWGMTRSIPDFCFVLDVSEPGLLVIKHRRKDGFGKFVNVAVLTGDQVKIVDEQSVNIPDCPDLLYSLLGFSSLTVWNKSLNVLVQLAVSMRSHQKGGILLVVPTGSETWRESIRHPMRYAVGPAYSELAELMLRQDDKDPLWPDEMKRAIDAMAGFTAVDGATIISDKYELYGFGAKIDRKLGSTPVEKLILTEPVIGGGAIIDQPALTGGTRHLSAAQFVYDQRDAIALVASQDGRFTIFSWSTCENMVQANRIDSLLL